LAEESEIVIAIEEIWNKLLSPLEMDRPIREFQSPWIKVWFDTGNVLLYGYPQDWIRALGKRIVKLHIQDFKRKEDGYVWANLGDGDADWPRCARRRRKQAIPVARLPSLKEAMRHNCVI
jgi:hexulose-6-phosphate isomerase